MLNKKARYRNFATVVYPESAPADWIDRLKDLKIPVLVSPLHDQDINPDGERKKPHYHVLFCFDGVKTIEQVNTYRILIGGVGHEIVASIRGYSRYLCHLDNPEKHRYSESDIQAFGGADYQDYVRLASDKYRAVAEMMDYCRDNSIYYYSDLLFYAKEHRFDWFVCLTDNCTFVVKEFLKAFGAASSRRRFEQTRDMQDLSARVAQLEARLSDYVEGRL